MKNIFILNTIATFLCIYRVHCLAVLSTLLSYTSTVITGITACFLSVFLFAFDITSSRLEAFYRIYYGNEQKAPFMLLLSAAFLILASRPQLNLFIIPAL